MVWDHPKYLLVLSVNSILAATELYCCILHGPLDNMSDKYIYSDFSPW